ncbi:hypothetical protein FISHEDRAFT_58387 [Fistulina hepatica ATCC 64428]|nr:hypothetical protein FISHEDRAFT_58387 [Fistulina hepatica ATCC 64428]
MHFHPLVLLLAAHLNFAQAGPVDVELDTHHAPAPSVLDATPIYIRRPDEHAHAHHAAPLLELNETQVTLYHEPIGPSYYTIDWEDPQHVSERHPGLIMTHALLMMSAFFGAYPIGIIMRSTNHAWHGVVVLIFYGLVALGCASSMLYRKLTPDMYPGSSHGRHGYFVLFIACALSIVDILSICHRVYAFFRSGDKFTFRGFWFQTILGQSDKDPIAAEYEGLVHDEPDEYDETKLEDDNQHEEAEWSNHAPSSRHRYSASVTTDHTLLPRRLSAESDDHHGFSLGFSAAKKPLLRRVGNIAFATLERVMVFAGLAMTISGIVIYTGGCRQNYINGCLAHLIKGAIFWCYGLVTFGRYLGSFSELGWAWNRAPRGRVVSAEFVESAVIFAYGITNTWMERFGANPGDPFTTKQIQHIGIAVMFWFAGLVGMALESRRVRRWLASSTIATVQTSDMPPDSVSEPPGYIASFNPFPALVIGVTGMAMAMHFQTYLFQVQIHMLWGDLLAAFSVLRCLTYFFLWLSPPRSILPSRPPTEALASFCLACGGLCFMFSTEEVTIAAMRRGRDDVMMFLNVAVAITCFAFCWTLCMVGYKGWLKSHSNKKVTFVSSA